VSASGRELHAPDGRFEWERIVRRCRISAQTKLVAFVMAQYGNQQGERIWPGVPKLAAVTGMGESTVRRHLERLVEYGLVERLTNGGGPNRLAASYRLTIPSDLGEHFELLTPEEGTPLAQVSAVPPVDNRDSRRDGEDNSAHSGERSSGGNSAHLEQELRSLGEVTPLTSGGNSAHSCEHPSSLEHPFITPRDQPMRSPEVGTSPVDVDEKRLIDPEVELEAKRHRAHAALTAWEAETAGGAA
jgi:DNA-binding MarR family transcriptional regulator